MDSIDKPRAQRQRTFKGAAIYYGGVGVMDCVIRNLSESGALLEVPDPSHLPNEFTLMLKLEHKRRPCRVAWRAGSNVGINFI
jgi:hypothetical protein